MGFRVMFRAESVADALSLILERFPRLPEVVFYDVACKMDRNGMQRVRTILSKHKVRFFLDRAHAKGHTCSCVYFSDESLSVPNGVTTQAAEVQHSISVKLRWHLAYMSPASIMAHRIVQLSYMNMAAAFKLHPQAKAENTGVRLNEFYFQFRGVKCVRRACCCPAGTQDWLIKSAPSDCDKDPGALDSSKSESSTDEWLPTEGGGDGVAGGMAVGGRREREWGRNRREHLGRECVGIRGGNRWGERVV
eukprot:TRINITY_DN6945_c0_g1_i1.p1 TRINITY_DN6945_c0_g1~~TRINITY_DN6945_c0_g1_i1.p1  ORF type:complete len:249 (+),score=39.47 TRINITY_DN6945_c0_g1_i1:1920-2666(+)